MLSDEADIFEKGGKEGGKKKEFMYLKCALVEKMKRFSAPVNYVFKYGSSCRTEKNKQSEAHRNSTGVSDAYERDQTKPNFPTLCLAASSYAPSYFLTDFIVFFPFSLSSLPFLFRSCHDVALSSLPGSIPHEKEFHSYESGYKVQSLHVLVNASV